MGKSGTAAGLTRQTFEEFSSICLGWQRSRRYNKMLTGLLITDLILYYLPRSINVDH